MCFPATCGHILHNSSPGTRFEKTGLLSTPPCSSGMENRKEQIRHPPVESFRQRGLQKQHPCLLCRFLRAYPELYQGSGVIADSGFYLKQFIERLEEERLTYIIAVKLFRPLQRQIYTITQWKEVARGLSVSEFSFMHPLWETRGGISLTGRKS